VGRPPRIMHRSRGKLFNLSYMQHGIGDGAANEWNADSCGPLSHLAPLFDDFSV